MHLPSSLLVRVFSVGLLTAAVFGRYAAQAQLSEEGRLSVSLTGLRNLDGQVCLSLFDSSTGFPEDETDVVEKQCIDASTAETSVEGSAVSDSVLSVAFENLVPGTSYSVSVMHDENVDGDLNKGTFGIPTEGFGFSRNPEIQMSAPEFYESAVLVLGETTTAIEMIYF